MDLPYCVSQRMMNGKKRERKKQALFVKLCGLFHIRGTYTLNFMIMLKKQSMCALLDNCW